MIGEYLEKVSGCKLGIVIGWVTIHVLVWVGEQSFCLRQMCRLKIEAHESEDRGSKYAHIACVRTD